MNQIDSRRPIEGFFLGLIGLAFGVYGNASCESWDPSAFSFESGIEGWQAGTSGHGQAIYKLEHDLSRAYLGKGSLKVFLDLVPGDPNKRTGEIWVDLRATPPRRRDPWPSYDLSEAVVTVAIWVPKEAVGPPQAPNGIQLFFKDSQGRAKYSRRINLTEIPAETWYQIAVDMESECWEWDGEADLGDVTAVGVKIAANAVPEARGFSGIIWLDAFNWVWPSLWFRGINYTAWSPEEYATPASDVSLFHIKSSGANFVAFLVTGYMEGANATQIHLDPARTPSDASLIHGISVAHSYGLKVMLKPHVDVKDGTWRGQIAPADVQAWFNSYTDFLAHYARLAEEHRVELFCVGTELRSLSGLKFRTQWKEVIAKVRAEYSGPLIYAANWDEYSSVSFWDFLDYVGINAYFSLSEAKTPSVEELVQAWAPWVSTLESWQAQIRKYVVFTEIGYRSIDYAARQPWDWRRTGAYNPEGQANAYQAVFQAFKDKSWFAGLFLWNWLPNPQAGGYGDVDYTPQNKPAQEILEKYFGKKFVMIADFEDGTRQCWRFSTEPKVSESAAHRGHWTLAFTLFLDGRFDLAGSLVRNMNFAPYNSFVVPLYVPPDAPLHWLSGVAFLKVGPERILYQGKWQNLQLGTWNRLLVNLQGIPNLDFVREVGFIVVGEGKGETTLFLDDIGLEKCIAKEDTSFGRLTSAKGGSNWSWVQLQCKKKGGDVQVKSVAPKIKNLKGVQYAW